MTLQLYQNTRNTCLVCGKSWFPRKEAQSKQCPRCRSVKWQTGKGDYLKKIKSIAVGEEIFFDRQDKKDRLCYYLNREALKLNIKIIAIQTETGVMVKRLS